jgi:Family of unknown function (DUF6169)
LETPFECKQIDESSFEFTTDHGVVYRASFPDAAGYFKSYPSFANQVRAFQFVVVFNPLPILPIDGRVGGTVSFLVLEFFEKQPEGILFFIHEGADGKQNGRRRKFDTWFKQRADVILIKRDATIPVGRFPILASLLLRNSHPKLIEVLESFDRLSLDAATKPEDLD